MAEQQLSLYRNYTNSDSVFVNNTYSVFPDASEFGWAKEGCVFKYWATNEDDSSPFHYNAGETVPTVILTSYLYAIWEEVYTTTGNELKSVANAIRTKGGTTELLAYPNGFISAIENLPSGGGDTGASNYVHGEFTTQSTAGVQTVTIPYTGTGYPVMAYVVIKGGAYVNGTDWYKSTQRYAVGVWSMSKSIFSSIPTFLTSGNNNQAVTFAVYKNSTTSSTSYTRTSQMTTNTFSSSNATNAAATCVRFKGNSKTLTVYVNTSSYGLLPNQDYEYFIVYSS